MKTSGEIRQLFFDFFREKGHTIVPSAPIVVKNDPTLLFTNAGMNQFKDFFLDNKIPPNARVADTQKCLRVSGKHNDLEEVGVDHYHHTMFEMLGNWSFGNAITTPAPYFKEEAIAFSFELLTKRYGIDLNDLYVTVFEGDASEGLPADKDSFNFWKQWLPEEQILYGNKKDNFWEMGDTGPCGPCTEIHFDARRAEEKSKVPGKSLVNQDHPEVIEIWNNVFIQFNRKSDGTLQPLPAKHVDTGMGFERLVRVLQKKKSNYDTDVFSNTIHEIEKISGKKYKGSQNRKDIAFRVIADHIRAVVFPVADGQLPSNTGAGYVIRRILRRAVRYYFTYLDVKEPLLFKLVPLIAGQFSEVFPEAARQKDFLAKVILEEEHSFLKTLGSGLKRLEQILSEKKNVIEGAVAFELFDTYGFPIDLTQLIASENNATVDMKGFAECMQQQKERSRAATQLTTGDWTEVREGDPVFRGYEMMETESHILKYREVQSKGKSSFQIVLDQTPFYAESGGQVGDTGTFTSGDEVIRVLDTKKENELIIHFADKIPSDPTQPLVAKIDAQKRQSIMLHHSATHLLHAALRKVLGKHVVQKGSLVNADYLRFDFSHFSKVSEEEIREVEKIVNEHIRQNDPVLIALLPKEKAMQKGAMALFGEKYSDTVRVVTMDEKFSVELCGGTHVGRTGELGIFKIIAETAVGAGVRRIEAITGAAAERYIVSELDLLHEIRSTMKNPKDLPKAIDQLLHENLELKKSAERLEKEKAAALARQYAENAEMINNISFIGEIVPSSEAHLLRDICLQVKVHNKNFVAVLAANKDGRANVAIAVDETLHKERSLDAGKLIKSVSNLINGGGGGNVLLATAGGQDVSKLNKVIDTIKEQL